jgi:hypothetical protein
MNWESIAAVSLVLAAIPAAMTLLNLLVYRRLPAARGGVKPAVSVLVPARDEAANIGAAIAAVLANKDIELELVVLDDQSLDRTAQIVQQAQRRDARVRLVHAPPLPAGWCGKQHACHVLAGEARHPLLVFVDADVRLAPDALARMAAMMQRPGAPALASGVPRQELGSFAERLLLPLIHFILLGFLPMHVMRATLWAGFSAGCGQLFVATRSGYEKSGGHAMAAFSLHDGLQLPRVFRRAGLRTGLFDPTDLATCRMYHRSAEVFAGLGKNATEGLAAPATILPMTGLLGGGQILPFLLAAASPLLPAAVFPLALLACLLAWLPRMVALGRFRQPLASALLHPLGVGVLLAIQWLALARRLGGQPQHWKGRRYPAGRTAMGAVLGLLALHGPLDAAAAPATAPARIELSDQNNTPHALTFPARKLTLISIADRHGRDQVRGWIPTVSRFKNRLTLHAIANAQATPAVMRNNIRKRIKAA